MVDYEQNIVLEPKKVDFFSSDHQYDGRKGFRLAFGLVSPDESSFDFDETYGELVAYQKEWGHKDAQGNIQPTTARPLNIKQCEESDVNFEGKD